VTEDLDELIRQSDKLPTKIRRYELTGKQIILYMENLDYKISFGYRLRAKLPLKAQVPPSSVYDYYNPEVSGSQAPSLVSVAIRYEAAAGEVEIDGTELTAADSGAPNLLTNGGFESVDTNGYDACGSAQGRHREDNCCQAEEPPDGRYLPRRVWTRQSSFGRSSREPRCGCWGAASWELRSIAFMPGGRYLARAGDDKKIRVSEVATGRDVQTLAGHDDTVTSIAFTSDELDIYAVSDYMSKKGWSLNGLQLPPALHIALTVRRWCWVTKSAGRSACASCQAAQRHGLGRTRRHPGP
jgi:hypothetical protein